jgi:hypothetical protein
MITVFANESCQFELEITWGTAYRQGADVGEVLTGGASHHAPVPALRGRARPVLLLDGLACGRDLAVEGLEGGDVDL